MSVDHPVARPISRFRIALILGSLTAMGPLAIDMYLPSLPTIVRELNASSAAVQVSLAMYFVGMAVGQAFYGPFSDRIGRKPALYLGLGVFFAASVGCALAWNVESLVAFRFLQALGGCAPIVIPRAVVRDHFDERESARMLSMLMLVMGLAPILAPTIGGQLLVILGWRSVFWLLAVYGALSWLLVALFLHESLAPERRRPQPIGVILATYGQLLRDRTYLGYVLAGGFMFAGLLAYIAGSPFVFIEIFHVPPERFGLFFGTNAAGLIAASQINRWLAGRTEPKRVIAAVLPIAMLSGFGILFSAYSGVGGFPGILIPLFCFISAYGFIMPNTTAVAMASHGAIAGSASALLGTLQFMLGATAGALVGELGNGTAVPFAAVIAGCGLSAFAVHRALPLAGDRQRRRQYA
ncbi:MAG TPA: Bcr/CflA family multidrug efflux MFS transporter [Vicinamibacterales bacterium]|nr:Bcr/CflA family multidrug efflux MFS transporter [Vicinamibacterales bacterium]